MKNILAKTGLAALSMLVAFFFSLPRVEAATFKVKCDKGKTIQKAIDRVKPGDVIEVSGTCNERVSIEPEINRITLDGQGTATIIGTNPNRTTILVKGRGITIKGFTITGGSNGILVQRGGEVTIEGNTLEHITRNGILVNRQSVAEIESNIIRLNRTGIIVIEGSVASIENNTIEGNDRDGILVRENSVVDLGGNITDSANKNGIFGLRCLTGGVVTGQLGTLNGDSDATNFGTPDADTCIESLSDFP